MAVVLQLTLTFDFPRKKYALYGAIKYHINIITKYTLEEEAQKLMIYSLLISKAAA